MFNEIANHIERVYNVPILLTFSEKTCLRMNRENTKDSVIYFNHLELSRIGIPNYFMHIVLLHELGHYLDITRNELSWKTMKPTNVLLQEYFSTGLIPEQIKLYELAAWKIAIDELFPKFNIELTQEIKNIINLTLTMYQVDWNRIEELFKVG